MLDIYKHLTSFEDINKKLVKKPVSCIAFQTLNFSSAETNIIMMRVHSTGLFEQYSREY